MGNRLKDQVAIVTGGGRGVGRGISLQLAAEGAKVVVNDLGGTVDGKGSSAEPADQVVSEIKKAGGTAIPCYESVASMVGGENIIKTALDKFGKLDILVHCAGILRDRMIFNMAEEEFDVVIQVHLKGMFALAKPASVLFRQQRSGRIVAMTSTSGLYGNAGQGNYGAAKDGIAGFVRTVARDLGRYGVTVNGIAPFADTRMTATVSQEAKDKRSAAGIQEMVGDLFASRKRPPEAIAPVVAFLCTEAAKNINGQFFLVNGGEISLLTNPYAAKTMQKSGRWTFEEMALLMPSTLTKDLMNPAPPMVPAKS